MKKVERVQTGLRLEKQLIKVMKALAEQLDMSAAELVEGVMLHALEGKTPFSEATLAKAAMLKEVYDLTLTAEDAHKLTEEGADT